MDFLHFILIIIICTLFSFYVSLSNKYISLEKRAQKMIAVYIKDDRVFHLKTENINLLPVALQQSWRKIYYEYEFAKHEFLSGHADFNYFIEKNIESESFLYINKGIQAQVQIISPKKHPFKQKILALNKNVLTVDPVFMYNLYVTPKQRGQGYASKLLEYIIKLKYSIVTIVPKNNTPVIKLLQKYKFKTVGFDEKNYLMIFYS